MYIYNDKINSLYRSDVESTESQQMTYTRDIARGMVYLTCKGFVHRDLAARNILVTADKTCKVNSYVVCRITIITILS